MPPIWDWMIPAADPMRKFLVTPVAVSKVENENPTAHAGIGGDSALALYGLGDSAI
jgi:hypothetical protein